MSKGVIISSATRCKLCQKCLQSNESMMSQVESDQPRARGTIQER